MRKVYLILCLFLFAFVLYGENKSQLSLNAAPTVHIPFNANPRYFTIGGGADISIEYRLPVVSFLGVEAAVSYAYLPIWTGDGTNMLTFGGGLGFYLPNLKKFTTKLFGTGGYYYGIIADNAAASGGNLYFSGGLRAGWGISPAYDLGLTVQYKYLADGLGSSLFSGLTIGVSNRYSFLRSKQLRLEDIHLDNIFPVLYKYYDGNSIGSVTIQNEGVLTAEDIEVTFFIEKYMDNPRVCPAPKSLEGGETAEVDLYALFAESVLEITEATVVSGKVTVSYTQNKKSNSVEKAESIRLYDRHAVTWDDDRKVSAYVTYKDPKIINVAKTLARTAKDAGIAVDTNLSIAMALHEALRSYGMTYVIDPTTPFIEFSQDSMAVDYIQFPRNTLHYKSGDCDDLSILYSSLLQAVGINTAFLTIPGHIFMAFALSLPPEEAQKALSDPEDIIVHEGTAWVPVEITRVNSSFLEAWKIGSMEWRENDQNNEARIYPVQASWELYEPVGFIGEDAEFTFVSDDEIESNYTEEKQRFINREIFAQTKDLKDRLGSGRKRAKALNKIGTVYARYGEVDEAMNYFNEALQLRESFPTLINVGNVLYMNEKLEDALSYYVRAEKMKPENQVLLLQLSRVHSRFGNFQESADYFGKLKSINPDMAARYSYLDMTQSSSARAAELGAGTEVMLWLELEDTE